MVQRFPPQGAYDLGNSSLGFPRQLDIAEVTIYRLSFLSVGLFLFLLIALTYPLAMFRVR